MNAEMVNEPTRKTKAPPPAAIAAPTQEKALITVSEGRPQYPTRAKEVFGIGPGEWRVLVDAIYPAAKSTGAVLMALNYCKARKLDIFKKPVHIVPIWNNKLKAQVETIWPGIAELRTTASRTGVYAGISETLFGPEIVREFAGEIAGKGRVAKVAFPVWAQVTVRRLVDGKVCEFAGPKVFWLETYSRASSRSELPTDMWEKRAYGQLEKCAEAAALRRAFPEELGNELTAEEMSGKEMDVEPANVAAILGEEPAIEGEVVEEKKPEPPPAAPQAATPEKVAEPEQPEMSVDEFLEGVTGVKEEPALPITADDVEIALALARKWLPGADDDEKETNLRREVMRKNKCTLEALPSSSVQGLFRWLNSFGPSSNS